MNTLELESKTQKLSSRPPEILVRSCFNLPKHVALYYQRCTGANFPQEMRLVFPNSHRINRGNYVVKELAEACRANDVTDLIVLHEHRGKPGTFILSLNLSRSSKCSQMQ